VTDTTSTAASTWLRRAGWCVLSLALLPAGVAQWRAHARLLEPSVHEPVPPDWVRYDAAREHLAGIDRVHIYADVDTRLLLLRRFDLQYAALPALIWDDPPGREPSAPPDERTAFLIDARSVATADEFTGAVREAAGAAGYVTTVIPLSTTLRLLRFEHEDASR